MKTGIITSVVVSALVAWHSPAFAEEVEGTYGPQDPGQVPAESQPDVGPPPIETAEPMPEPADDGPFFPIWGKQARERGIELLPAFGVAGMVINNRQELGGENLAVAIKKGEDLAPDATLIDLPFVVPTQLESHTANRQAKVDLWVFPFLDLYAALGKAKGHMDITVDIDLDAFVPFPFCRPAKPCGITTLPFEAEVDNTTLTFGGVLAYGSEKWFISATAAKTRTMSKKERSDIKTTDIGVRGGPRFKLSDTVSLAPYVGADYFNFDAQVTGVVQSGPLFDDGDPITMRYRIDLAPLKPWAAIAGGNLQIGRHLTLQGEYNWGAGSNRFMVSVTYRP